MKNKVYVRRFPIQESQEIFSSQNIISQIEQVKFSSKNYKIDLGKDIDNIINDWLKLFNYQQFIQNNYNNWNIISKIKLSDPFIRMYNTKVYWRHISMFQGRLSEKLIYDFKDKVFWEGILQNNQLSENLIRDCQDIINWAYVSGEQTLSEKFVREFQHKIRWSVLCATHKLSEDFMKEFRHFLDWTFISLYQPLTNEFIVEFKEDIILECINRYTKKTKLNLKHMKP